LSGLARQTGRLHLGGLLLVALLVIAAHLLLLGSVDGFALVMSRKTGLPPRSVQVMSMTEAEPVVAQTEPAKIAPPVAAAAPAPKAAPAPRRHRPKPAPKASHEPAAATAATEAPTSPPEPVVAVAEASPTADSAAPAEPEASAASEPAAAPAAPPASEAPASSSGEAASAAAAPPPASAEASAAAPSAGARPPAEPMPVYPTSLPPAFSFAYDLSRTPLRGNGNLVFSLTDAGYEARLTGSVAGFSVLEWISRGGFDDAGFAPLRFTEQRLRRAPTAANFQREAGKISYSANSDEVPLPPGAQDRLSWMLQLAAIAHARPEKLTPGQRITMFVTGVRADAEPWSFSVVGPETVRIPLGSVDTVHLLREPRFAHDTRADVWLDPSRHHLPVRARLSNSEDGSDAFELQLREAPASLP